MDITHLITQSTSRTPYLVYANQIYTTNQLSCRIILTRKTRDDWFEIQTHLSNIGNESTELAYFRIHGTYCRAPFEQLSRIHNAPGYVPPNMNIDCSDYRGKGVSKMLILITFHFAKIEYPRFNLDTELFIDTDASDVVDTTTATTYWTAIGMVENSHPPNHVSSGYEKMCRVKDLMPYLFRLLKGRAYT
jgi:hypothetical protein